MTDSLISQTLPQRLDEARIEDDELLLRFERRERVGLPRPPHKLRTVADALPERLARFQARRGRRRELEELGGRSLL